MKLQTAAWTAVLGALCAAGTGCNEGKGGGGGGSAQGLVSAPAIVLPPTYVAPPEVSSQLPPTRLPAADAKTEALAQESRRSFDGDTRSLDDLEVEPVSVVGGLGQGFVGYTDEPRADTLTINEPPPPGGRPKRVSLESGDWVFPVPTAANGDTAEVSSGRNMRAGNDGKMGTADDYRHRGNDIMYRRDKKTRKCGEQALPWFAACYFMPDNTPALAVGPGVVLKSAEISTGGRVLVDHGGGVRTAYVHLSKRLVKEGDRVVAGQPVGIIGFDPSGYKLAHLHFDVMIDGKFVDPAPYLKKWRHRSLEAALVAVN